MADRKIYTDGGYGMTDHSVEYFRKLKGKLGSIHKIRIDDGREFSTEITSDKAIVLLSGVNCGYGGTGPHGTVRILDMLGLKTAERVKRIFGEKQVHITPSVNCEW